MFVDLEDELARHLNRLCVEIGPRPNGSPGNRAAADYIRGIFQDAGLEIEEQRFACPVWEHQQTTLLAGDERLEAAANAFSPPCNISGPAVAIGTIPELEAAQLGGRISILYGDLTSSPLAPKAWFLKTERDEQIVRLLEEKMPLALITIQAAASELERLIEDSEFIIPSATVPARVGLALLKEDHPIVHLRIESRQSLGYASNIVAQKAGNNPSRIVLCAHYDTKIDTPGAYDNGGGVAALLTMAQLLSQKDLSHSLEWVAFSGEDYLPMGDDEYVRRREGQFEKIVAAVNMDGVGQYLGANSIAMFASSHAFQEQVAELTQEYPGVVWVEPWPESNHSTFAWRGVPSVALTSRSGGYPAHLRSDTVDWISPAKLAETVSLVTNIVELLQDKSLAWTREAG